MEANDIYPSRLEAAKETAIDFINSNARGNNIGIVSFAGSTLIEQELASDYDAVRQSIRNIKMSSVGGTDLYEVVITSANMLREEKARALIILSDGRFNVGSVDDAIDYANKKNIIVFTIGIGTEEGGKTSYGLSTIEQNSLKSIAYLTNGKFFLATSKEELSRAFSEIITLKTREISVDLSLYLALAALILFVMQYILINTRFRLFP